MSREQGTNFNFSLLALARAGWHRREGKGLTGLIGPLPSTDPPTPLRYTSDGKCHTYDWKHQNKDRYEIDVNPGSPSSSPIHQLFSLIRLSLADYRREDRNLISFFSINLRKRLSDLKRGPGCPKHIECFCRSSELNSQHMIDYRPQLQRRTVYPDIDPTATNATLKMKRFYQDDNACHQVAALSNAGS